ncbi:MAG: glycosyltransferase family 9 protein [Candidatus Eisenbacteria bacterium]
MNPRAVLVVRPDRIGDVVLTTPVFRALKHAWPATRVGALVRPAVAPLLEGNPDVDAVVLERGQSLGELTGELRAGGWEASVHAFLTPRTVLAAALARIPRRIGPASKLPALLLTERVVQKRSHSLRHEADYNLELLAPLGIPVARYATRIELSAAEREWARRHLAELGVPAGRAVAAIHPGSGNSAGRWPSDRFAALAERLAAAGTAVLLTYGPEETELADRMNAVMRTHVPVVPPGSVTLRQMAAIVSTLSLFVGNSTGPLHIAVALDVPTVSFYTLTPATRPSRWGPYASGHVVLTPPDTPGTLTRLDQVSVDAAFDACRRQLARAGV